MRYISALLILSVFTGFFPADFALASGAPAESASIWEQIGNLFSPDKTQSNVEQLSSPSEPVVVEQPKLSLGDYFASRWDNVKESVSDAFSSIPLPHFTNPLSNFTFPKIGNNAMPAPVIPPAPEKKTEAPASVENPSPAVQAQEEPIQSPESSIGSVLKTELVSGLVGAAAGFGLSLSTKTFLTYSASYIAPVITEYATLLTYSEYAAIAGTGFGLLGGSLMMYAWGGNNANAPAFLKDTARQFRKTVDGAYVGTINLFTLKNSQYDPEKPNQPSMEDILTGAGALQPKTSGSAENLSVPVLQIKSGIAPVPEAPAPAISSDQPETLFGGNLNWAGSLTVTYYGCGDSGLQYGPYTADWTSKLSQEANTPDLAYSGSVNVLENSFGGNFRIFFDEANSRWKAIITTADFKITNPSYSIVKDPKNSFFKGNLVMLSGGSRHAIGIDCQSGAGNFSGKAGQ